MTRKSCRAQTEHFSKNSVVVGGISKKLLYWVGSIYKVYLCKRIRLLKLHHITWNEPSCHFLTTLLHYIFVQKGRRAYLTDCQSTVVVKGELLSAVKDRPRQSGTRHCNNSNSNSFATFLKFGIALFGLKKKRKQSNAIR